MPVIGGPKDDDSIMDAEKHLILFTDHSGRPARVVFHGLEIQPLLPQLFMLAIYFTHADATPDNVDMKGLLDAVRFNKNYPPNFRLELFFLPGATEDDCIAHYRGEKAARGTYDAQIDALDNPATTTTFTTMDSPPTAGTIPEGGSLPGMVPSYAGGEYVCFDELLFICPEKNWSDGDQAMWRIRFDHVGPERYKMIFEGLLELEETPPSKSANWIPINDKSPSYCEYDPTVSETIFDAVHAQDETTGVPFDQASESGWVCW
jgi:hypothetical protein